MTVKLWETTERETGMEMAAAGGDRFECRCCSAGGGMEERERHYYSVFSESKELKCWTSDNLTNLILCVPTI